MQRMSSRDFNQDVGRAKRAAEKGPIVITDRGRPAYVLMKHALYRRLTKRGPSIAALLAEPKSNRVEFDPPRLGDAPVRPG